MPQHSEGAGSIAARPPLRLLAGEREENRTEQRRRQAAGRCEVQAVQSVRQSLTVPNSQRTAFLALAVHYASRATKLRQGSGGIW